MGLHGAWQVVLSMALMVDSHSSMVASMTRTISCMRLTEQLFTGPFNTNGQFLVAARGRTIATLRYNGVIYASLGKICSRQALNDLSDANTFEKFFSSCPRNVRPYFLPQTDMYGVGGIE
jgi:hypothetical protein